MDTYLLKWNDEYLTQTIVAGPFAEADGQEILKSEIMKQLQTIESKSEEEAELIYTCKGQDINGDCDEIDLSISPFGSSLRYGSGYEERLTLVGYKAKPV